MTTFQIYRGGNEGTDEPYWWRAVSKGRKTASSVEGFTSRFNARRAIRAFVKSVGGDPLKVVIEDAPSLGKKR